MTTQINNENKKLNFSNEREQSQACLNSAEHEKNQGRKVLNVPNLRFPEFQGEWEKKSLGEIGDSFIGLTYKPTDVVSEGGLIVFRSSNIQNGCMDYKDIVRVNKNVKEKLITKKDDLLVCARNGSARLIGKNAILHEADANQTFGAFMMVFRSDKNHFVHQLLNTRRYSSQVSENLGARINQITSSDLSSFEFFFPTENSEMNKIAALLDLLDERIATQNKIIDKLQSLIKGIRNDVFGKLRKSVGFNAMISDVLSYEQPQPYIVENTEYTAEGTPVLTANKAFVLGYTSETNGIYDKGDCIIFDDFTLDCKYVDFPYKIKSSAIKILTAKNKEILRYTFEFLKYLDLSTDEHKRHYIAETQNQEFVLPTMQIVRTIAHAFSALSLRMESVVKQRNMFETQKQYLLRQMFI